MMTIAILHYLGALIHCNDATTICANAFMLDTRARGNAPIIKFMDRLSFQILAPGLLAENGIEVSNMRGVRQ